MNAQTTTLHHCSSISTDAALAELVENYLARLQAGETIPPHEFAARHPEHAERLERLLPALELMDDLRRSSSNSRNNRSLTPVLMETPGVTPGLLGDYQILREVGRGGMGVVYEARQISLNRRVALKVLPMAAAMDSRQLQRFQVEAQAAACLHHTNIVPIHAVGCERGVHYYAMQFIEGQTLASIIRELRIAEGLEEDKGAEPCETQSGFASKLIENDNSHRQGQDQWECEATAESRLVKARQEPRTPGSTLIRDRAFFRTVANLGIQAAEALEHAHGLGVIHRDIKPANLMVDDRGALWITDFGLARLQSDSGLTMTGDLMGTLRYMSPEQALAKRGYLDHRTDIYSLGVTLYELLTLRPAIQGADRQELLRSIAQDDPVSPRTHEPSIPRELETILLKAINKEPESRYATSRELADDLGRFLEHRPIRAKRPTPLERAVKWGRRHPAVVGASIAILAVSVLALLANAILVGREQRQTAAALKLAESRSRQARQAVDKMYTRVAEKWLVDQPGLRPLQREFLEDALAFYQEFASQEDQDPEARIDQAAALRRVADIEDALNRHEDIERILLRAISLLEDLDGVAPNNPRCHEELAAARLKLAWLNRIDGRIKEAGQRYNQALQTYQSLSIRYPGRWDYQDRKGECLIGLAVAHFDLGELDEAIRLCLQARDVYESMGSHPEARSKSVQGLSQVYHYLGFCCFMPAGRFSEAEAQLRKAAELSAQILAGSPASPKAKHEHASNLERLAEALKFQSKWAEAENNLREAIQIQGPLALELPETTDFRQDLTLSLCELGEVLYHRGGRSEEIEKMLTRSIGISKEIIASAPKLIFRRVIMARVEIVLASLERDQKHFDASRELLEDARLHVQAALAINPLDPHVNELNAKLEAEEEVSDRTQERNTSRPPTL
jgi:serine/threonine protein kinase